jgi:hypothetical protein
MLFPIAGAFSEVDDNSPWSSKTSSSGKTEDDSTTGGLGVEPEDAPTSASVGIVSILDLAGTSVCDESMDAALSPGVVVLTVGLEDAPTSASVGITSTLDLAGTSVCDEWMDAALSPGVIVLITVELEDAPCSSTELLEALISVSGHVSTSLGLVGSTLETFTVTSIGKP